MRVYISKINKRDFSEVYRYKYEGSKKTIACAIWTELLEEKYLQNPIVFNNSWKAFSQIRILVDDENINLQDSAKLLVSNTNRFLPENLLHALFYSKIIDFESFLECIYGNEYRFIIR